MSDQFLGEIRLFPFNFAPAGWAFCNGQLLPLSQNTALFSLLGTTYGGNGTTNFALPNLQGMAPMHPGQGPGLSMHDLGESSGSDAVTLITSELPSHSHQAMGQAVTGSAESPSGALWAYPRGRRTGNAYTDNTGNPKSMSNQAIAPVGGYQPHNNMQPYLTMNFCIALVGIYPPRS